MNGDQSNYARTLAKREAVNEAEFGLGYLFKTLENDINAYTNQEGYPYSFAVVAHRLGRLLEASAIRAEPRLAELVPEMFQNAPRALPGPGNQLGGHEHGAEAEVHVRPRVGRPLGRSRGPSRLSPESRQKIADAQRARWAKQKQARARWAKQKQAGWTPERRAQYSKRLKAMYADPKLGKELRRRMNKMRTSRKGKSPKLKSKMMSNYWSKMTPEQRATEMVRRRQVTLEKQRKALSNAS